MLYAFMEMTRAAMLPWRAAANVARTSLRSPLNPVGETLAGRTAAAAADVFESLTRYYGKPSWGLEATEVNGQPVGVDIETVWKKPFCGLLHFARDREALAAARGVKAKAIDDPRLLIVAPLSGHYATLLRGTVEAFLPTHEVYITDWTDARMVPVLEGRFGLGDYVQYVREMITVVGPGTHVAAVCQPGPPVLAAVAMMAEDKDPARPATMTFMGSPIDTRLSPTVPNKLSEERPFEWFRDNLIHTVPGVYPGAMRRVYPGFLQLTGFINMNYERHVDAHYSYFTNLVKGDGDSADRHRQFYDEYLSVMDLTEEFYLETIDQEKLTGSLFSRRRTASHPTRVDNALFMNRSVVYRDDLYRNIPDLRFSIPVAQNIYLDVAYRDSMFQTILNAKLLSQTYRYSDLNFILLQRIAENLTGESFDLLCVNQFYSSLGAGSLMFNPWRTVPKERIVPTEDDRAFRRQLIHGFVHDQTAAMMGGVAGHAGLFGNANDLAKLMQMFLNNGLYGGQRYLNHETVAFFTRQQHAMSRRALGFDKPEPDPSKESPVTRRATPRSYGHTGFSGTLVWVDPEYDLVYIFLSNRIHPESFNRKLTELKVRTRIHEVIYRAIEPLPVK